MGSDVFYKAGLLFGAALVLMFWLKPLDISMPNLSNLLPQAVTTPSGPPIAIVLVGSQRNVAAIRSAVHRDRVVAETPSAFALDEGRVIATSIEAASAPLNAAGWADRPIEIVTPPSRQAAVSGKTPGGERDSSGDLMKQDTISMGQTMKLLKQMEARGDF